MSEYELDADYEPPIFLIREAIEMPLDEPSYRMRRLPRCDSPHNGSESQSDKLPSISGDNTQRRKQ